MALEILLRNITRHNIRRAVAEAKVKAANVPAWVSALDKVEKRLEKNQWSFDGTTLVIKSSESDATYHLSDNGCQCTAYSRRIPCVHRACRKVLINTMGFSDRMSIAEQAADAMTAEELVEDAMAELALDADALLDAAMGRAATADRSLTHALNLADARRRVERNRREGYGTGTAEELVKMTEELNNDLY